MTIQLSPRVSGRLNLDFVYDRERQLTQLARCEQQPPLRVISPFALPHGACLLHLHNLSGGVLGGDQLSMGVNLGPAARVQLTTTGATRLYRSRADALPARQETVVRIQKGALLEYLPDQLIPFAASRYIQHTRIELAEDAGLMWWETIAPGRLARGESFAYQQLHMHMDILVEERLIASEHFKLEPQNTPLTSTARLGPYKYYTSFFLCKVGLPAARWSELEREGTALALQQTRPGEILWSASTLVAHGLVVRAVSCQSYTIPPGLLAFWELAKQALYNEKAILPRKLY